MRMSRVVTTLAAVGLVVATVAGCSAGVEAPTDDVTVYDAAYVSYDSVESLTARAELVIEGEVVSSEVRKIKLESMSDSSDPTANPALGATTKPVEEPTLIYTVLALKVDRAIQGDVAVGSLVEVKQLGGTIGSETAVQHDAANLVAGSTYILYLGSPDYGPASLLNQSQAAYVETSPGEFASVVQGDPVAARIAESLSAEN